MTDAKTLRFRTVVAGLLLALGVLGISVFATPALAQFGLDDTVDQIDGIDTTQDSLPVLIGRIIAVALQLVGVIFFVLMVYAGFLWMTAKGNDTQVDKAKSILIAAIIGLVIIGLAYAITSFVVNRVSGAVSGEETSWAPLINVAHAQDAFGTGNLEETGGGVYGDSFSDDPDSLPVIIGRVVKILISVIGIIFVVLTVYAGYLWMTAQGDDDKVSKAKDTLRQGIIGMLLMLMAYAIASFVVSRISGAVVGS